jgi:hypothetical protein
MALCDLFEPPVQCNERRLAQQRAEWEHAVEEQQELNRLRIQVSENIGNARARFWATYPDKPGADKAGPNSPAGSGPRTSFTCGRTCNRPC